MTKVNYWERLSSNVQSPRDTYNKRGDVSEADASFILRFAGKNSSVLDLGSGTGTVVNRICREVGDLVAVETYPGFSRFIAEAENVLVINANLENFMVRKFFDVATVTAVMQYFPEESARQIYSNLYAMLKPGGTLIARNHVGVRGTVRVEKSEELQSEYFAEYRDAALEKSILEECGFAVSTFDEVPAEHNVWETTRHLYFVGLK